MILEKTTIKGIWWRANDPAKKLQGQITYGPACGAEVDLFGQFYESFDDKTLTERFTLHGSTFKTTPISLFGSIITGGEIHLQGGRTCKIKSCSGVVGGHFSAMENVSFKEVYVYFKGLTDWTCIAGMQLNATEEPQGFVANYKFPSVVSLGNYGAFSIRLDFSGHLQPGFHGLQFQEECVLVITAQQMEPFTAFEQHILTFQRFLSLAIQRPTPALRIVGHIDKPREVIQDKPIIENFLIIRELEVPNWSRDSLIPQDFLFALPELGTSPETVYGKFVDRQGVLLSALDLYFSTVYHEGQSPRVDFLILAQGLERISPSHNAPWQIYERRTV